MKLFKSLGYFFSLSVLFVPLFSLASPSTSPCLDPEQCMLAFSGLGKFSNNLSEGDGQRKCDSDASTCWRVAELPDQCTCDNNKCFLYHYTVGGVDGAVDCAGSCTGSTPHCCATLQLTREDPGFSGTKQVRWTAGKPELATPGSCDR